MRSGGRIGFVRPRQRKQPARSLTAPYYLGPGTSDPYAVVNLGARYQLHPRIQLFAQVNNLFDRRYYTAAQLAPPALPNGIFIARPFPPIAGEFPMQHSTSSRPARRRRSGRHANQVLAERVRRGHTACSGSLHSHKSEGTVSENLIIFSREEVLRLIRGEYLEMPGLRLTHAQAQRLWGLDAQTCASVLETLREDAFLAERRWHIRPILRRPDGICANTTFTILSLGQRGAGAATGGRDRRDRGGLACIRERLWRISRAPAGADAGTNGRARRAGQTPGSSATASPAPPQRRRHHPR